MFMVSRLHTILLGQLVQRVPSLIWIHVKNITQERNSSGARNGSWHIQKRRISLKYRGGEYEERKEEEEKNPEALRPRGVE